MEIVLNGDKITLPTNLSIEGLIGFLALKGKRLAVELNQQIIPRSQHAHTLIQPDDVIEIIHAVGGG